MKNGTHFTCVKKVVLIFSTICRLRYGTKKEKPDFSCALYN